MKSLVFTALITILAMAFSLNLLAIKGDNMSDQQTSTDFNKQLETVTELSLDGNFKINLSQDKKTNFNLSEKNASGVTYSIENNRLIIKQKSMLKKAEINLTLSQVTQIESKGILTLKGQKAITGEHLNLNLNGLVSVELNEIIFNSITGTSSGVSLIVLKGKADDLKIDFNGFGMVDNNKLVTKSFKAKNNSIGLLPTLSEMISKFD